MTPQLNAALAKAKLEFPQILAKKTVNIPTKSGRQISFTYAELEEILEVVTPVLSVNSLSLSSRMHYLSNNKFVLTTSLRHDSGEVLESHFPLPESVGDAKELGIQISYGRRYNALCLLEISTVEPSDKEQWQEKKRKLASELRTEIKEINQNETEAIVPSEKNSGINRNLVNAEIDSLIKRKSISIEEAKEIVETKYKVRSRQNLSDSQLIELLELLRLRPNETTSA